MLGGPRVALATAGVAVGLGRLRLVLAVADSAPLPETGDPRGLRLPRPRRATGRPAEPPIPEPSTPAPDAEQAEVLQIVARAQAGDAEAFGQLYDRYVDVVYRYVAFRVGSSALAEDVTSETFLRALRRIGSFQWQGRDFGAWLVTIARNLLADHYKSSRYRLELSTADFIEAGADQPQAGPEGAVLEALSNQALIEAVKRLGSEQQECIALRFLQGLSVAETAQIMGKNEGAIKALQYRAVRALARLLPEEQW
jgi:RNA polymerase sigma-70 factor (ECF subfamily)